MQFKLIIASIAASAVSGVLAAPGPNNNIAAREQQAQMAELTQLSDLAKQEGQLMNQINEKFEPTYQQQVQQHWGQADAKYPTLEDVQALKEQMKQHKEKRDADPEAWNMNVGYNGWVANVNFGYNCGWQDNFPYIRYAGLFDNNPCNWWTGFGLYNTLYNCPQNYWW
ncbi:hypothetical protein Slin14017_G081010 [Septoria linicola]|nr:hypothetical protein Slin14017_G081010 [Septoria linicola]